MARIRPRPSLTEGFAHDLALAAHGDGHARRELAQGGDLPVDVGEHRAQVAPFDVRRHVHDALDVEVVDLVELVRLRQQAEVAQALRRRRPARLSRRPGSVRLEQRSGRRRSDRRVEKVLHRDSLRQRRFDDHHVVDVVGRIQEVRRRHRAGSTDSDVSMLLATSRWVRPTSEARTRSTFTTGRVIEHLLDHDVLGARDARAVRRAGGGRIRRTYA